MDRILVVNYFDIKSAVSAFTGLHRDYEDGIQIEYYYDANQQLSSINESPDSGGSEKSEEGSDSERKARESLETTKAKLKQEYESLEDPPAKEADPLKTNPVASKTMPLPFTLDFANSGPAFHATSQFASALEQTHNFSDSSFDNDTISEG